MLTFNDEDTSRWCRIACGIDMPDQTIMKQTDDFVAPIASSEETMVADREVTLDRLRAVLARGEIGDAGWDRRCRRLESWREDQAASDSGTEESRPGTSPEMDAEPMSPEIRRDVETETPDSRIETGWHGVGETDGFDVGLGGGLVCHGVHEWIGDASDRFGETRGNPGGKKRTGHHWLPCLGPICAVVHRLSSTRRGQGRSAPMVVWIGRRCRPTSWSLISNRRPIHPVLEPGATVRDSTSPDPLAALLSRTLVVQPPGDRVESRRWVLEHAIRNPAIDVAVADGRGFSPLDTRRLQVAMSARRDAGRPPITVMLVRPPEDLEIRSAATTRWSVRSRPPCSNVQSDAGSSIGESQGWRVELCRVRMPQAIGMDAARHRIVAEITPDWDRPVLDDGIESPSKKTLSPSETIGDVPRSRNRIHEVVNAPGLDGSPVPDSGSGVVGPVRGDPSPFLRIGSCSPSASAPTSESTSGSTFGPRSRSEDRPASGSPTTRSGTDGNRVDSDERIDGTPESRIADRIEPEGFEPPFELLADEGRTRWRRGSGRGSGGHRVPGTPRHSDGEGLLFSGTTSRSPGGNGGG